MTITKPRISHASRLTSGLTVGAATAAGAAGASAMADPRLQRVRSIPDHSRRRDGAGGAAAPFTNDAGWWPCRARVCTNREQPKDAGPSSPEAYSLPVEGRRGRRTPGAHGSTTALVYSGRYAPPTAPPRLPAPRAHAPLQTTARRD